MKNQKGIVALRWFAAVFMLLGGIVFAPSVASIFMVLFAIGIAPVTPIQDLITTKLKLAGKTKTIVLTALFLLSIFTAPTSKDPAPNERLAASPSVPTTQITSSSASVHSALPTSQSMPTELAPNVSPTQSPIPAPSPSPSQTVSAPVESEQPPAASSPVQSEAPAKPEPPETKAPSSQGVYVGSTDSDKYHYPSCRWAKKILAENEIWFATEDEAKAAGYSACGTCDP